MSEARDVTLNWMQVNRGKNENFQQGEHLNLHFGEACFPATVHRLVDIEGDAGEVLTSLLLFPGHL
jgi:hypothetical protein